MDYIDTYIVCPYFKLVDTHSERVIAINCEGAGERITSCLRMPKKQALEWIKEKCCGINSCRSCWVCRANDEYWEKRNDGRG